MAAGKRFYETGWIAPTLHGKSSQLQPGDPPFGAGLQGGDAFRGKG